MKSLFSETSSPTKDSARYGILFKEALRPIVKQCAVEGFNLRELEHIVLFELVLLQFEELLQLWGVDEEQ